MPDRRSQILGRLEEILLNIEDAPSLEVYRNRAGLGSDKRPCSVLLDGREETHQSFEGHRGRVYARTSPYIMRLLPEIYALMRRRTPDQASGYAAEIAAYRNGILRAVLFDSELAAITGTNGDIVYRGHDTDMQSGSSMEGVLRMDFAFYYVLDPSDL